MTYDMKLVRGDTLAFGIRIDGDVGEVLGLAMSCRALYGADDGEYVFQKTLEDGIEPVTGEDSAWSVRVAPEDTANVRPGRYEYDVQFTIGADVYTPLHGVLEILRDVTR